MHQAKKSPSHTVGARAVRSGWVGLHGRPRPVPLAPTLEEHDPIPPRATMKALPSPGTPPSPLRLTRVLFPTINTLLFPPHRVLLKHHRGPLQCASRSFCQTRWRGTWQVLKV